MTTHTSKYGIMRFQNKQKLKMALTAKPITELSMAVDWIFNMYKTTSENTQIHIAGTKKRRFWTKAQLEFQNPAAHIFGAKGKSLFYRPTRPK